MKKKAKRIRIISAKYLSNELKKMFTEENECYFSNNKKWLLITDANKFDSLGRAIYINDCGKRHTIQLFTVNYWIKRTCKNKYSCYFGQRIPFTNFCEATAIMCDQWADDGIIYTSEWYELIDNYLKLSVIIELIQRFEEDKNILNDMNNEDIQRELQDMEYHGYDVNILKTEIEKII